MRKSSHFGKIIRHRRLALGLTQERVAEIADLHRNYIGDIERGQKEPTISVFVRLCIAVELSPPEILTEIDYDSKR